MTHVRAVLGALLLFTVSASAQVFSAIEVFPSVAVKGVTQTIRIRSEQGFTCDNDPLWCGVSSVTIGGVKSPSVSTTELFAEIEAVVPDLPAGTFADVVVTDTHGNQRRKAGALHIVDPNAEDAAAAFDRVLIPIIYNGPGQLGSNWSTDVWLMNGGTYDIPLLRGPVTLLAREHVARVTAAAPNGYVLYPAKNATDDLAVNVLVRDLSRQSEALGTELPAVRERDFENRRIILMNIPSDPRFRLMLRAYALDRLPVIDVMNYWLYDLETGQQISFGTFRLSPPSDDHSPWAASLDLTTTHPEIARHTGPMRLSISPLRPDPLAHFWAFVSVTNNETQHVTAITPNP